jgi:hypothetical protein
MCCGGRGREKGNRETNEGGRHSPALMKQPVLLPHLHAPISNVGPITEKSDQPLD